MGAKAICALSFGGGPDKYRVGRPNWEFAGIIAETMANRNDIAAVLVQDYIESALSSISEIKPDLAVWEHREPGKFLDSKEVIAQFAEWLRHNKPGVDKILLVAHPFPRFFPLQPRKCIKCFRQEGFNNVEFIVKGDIPFDPECKDWWVRSASNLFAYAMRQLVTGKSGR